MLKYILFICLPFTIVFSQDRSVRPPSQRLEKEKLIFDTRGILGYVDPFIGTGGHGHTFPGASAPFGMMQLSPDTRYEGWDGCSGYHYSDDVIYGFSHTHLSGTGVPDYCDLLIVPQMGKPKTTPGYKDPSGYGAKFQHKNEKASPGYYEVKFDNGIKVQLATTERCGLHVYQFPDATSEKSILIDLDHRDELLLGKFNIIDKRKVEGIGNSTGWAKEQHFNFSLETSIDCLTQELITENGQHKLLLTLPKETTELKIKVGISSVDMDGARKNLTSELTQWDIESVKSYVEKLWFLELSKIQIIADNKDDYTKFYTALYHCFLTPNIFNDVDNRYYGRDGEIHKLPVGDSQYTVFSLWDTYRAAHPLYTITQPERTLEFVKTFQRQFEEGGDLPVWELAGNETECMIGYHSVSVIADAYVKGLLKMDMGLMFKAITATANFDEYGKKSFNEKGFIGVCDEPESVSKTLEYAYDSYCIYLALTKAKEEGLAFDESMISVFLNRSFNFINAYDPSSGGFMRGRKDGMWFSPFKPEEVNFNYTEANSWQYSLYAPQSINVLIELLDNGVGLKEYLNRLFTTKSELSGREQADITGLIGQYAHGNEPSHHMAYLYNYTDEVFRTADIVDSILSHYYTTEPDGLSGNEDCGQMSAWYVLSSLGFYPVCPGVPNYALGRPIFKAAKINLGKNQELNINYLKNSKDNKYILDIKMNGVNNAKRYITHQDLMKGGNWEVAMSNIKTSSTRIQPDTSGAKLPATFIPVPYFNQETNIFEKSLSLSLAQPLIKRKFDIYYTINGTDPTAKKSVKFTKPFTIDANTTVKAVVYNPVTKKYGQVISNDFILKDKTVSLKLTSEYANQYAANGPSTLIDGVKGNAEYRTGDWQGYWNKDLSGTVSFTEARKLNVIGIRCLQDVHSWIFPPKEVVINVYYSDGTSEIKSLNLKEAEEKDLDEKTVKLFEFKLDGKSVKSFDIKAVNFGKCPEWHLGNGNDTWLFADEIFFN